MLVGNAPASARFFGVVLAASCRAPCTGAVLRLCENFGEDRHAEAARVNTKERAELKRFHHFRDVRAVSQGIAHVDPGPLRVLMGARRVERHQDQFFESERQRTLLIHVRRPADVTCEEIGVVADEVLVPTAAEPALPLEPRQQAPGASGNRKRLVPSCRWLP